jgi:predicted phage baseplate assembly protein
MSKPSVICYDDRRRAVLRAEGHLNGIDYVEFDYIEVAVEERAKKGARKAAKAKATQPVLKVYFLCGLPPAGQPPLFDTANVVIEGGRSITGLKAKTVTFEHAPDPERDDVAIITLDQIGDHSTYMLRLVGADNTPLPGIDPRYSAAPFSFLLDDGIVQIDCLQPDQCPSEPMPAPELNYLAKDYTSFRQLLLDRLAATLPSWRERHTPDLYLTLAEALAYTADHLSYAQDAVATEAYLDTARLRISVRRHARLADYAMHEGCNARAWVCFEVESDPELPADALALITRPDGAQFDGPVLLPDMLRQQPRTTYEVFEPLIEPGREDLTERDIERPRSLARRLRPERGPAATRNSVVSYIRSRLSNETRALLDIADGPAEDLPRLIAALAAEFDQLLADPGLALLDHGAALAVERYGTPNALRGACLCRHNRRKIEETFPDEIARPARLRFHQAHNELHFYTWKQAECCLLRGATSATLRDAWQDDARKQRALRYLRPGDVLIFEERLGPRSGNPADADPAHRHAVRLTQVQPAIDPLCDVPVVEITWEPADALPFALCLSAIGPAPECALLEDITIAHGNVVLVDHGETVRAPDPARLRDGVRTIVAVPFEPPFDVVPAEELATRCVAEGRLAETFVQAGRYEPALAREPLVFSQPLPQQLPPASRTLLQEVRRARPQVALFSPIERPHPRRDLVERLPDYTMVRPGHMLYERWLPQLDLLASDADDRHFVVEVDDVGIAHLRFGDGQLGVRPEADTRFLVSYRVGGGLAGNVGADAISYALLRGEIRGGAILRIRNPLPAQGGMAAEPVAEVRLRAPYAFRSLLMRAITTNDYAAIVLRDFADRVQRAAARVEAGANGRSTMTVLIDPLSAETDAASLCASVKQHLEQFRRIGHDLVVVPAVYVPIELTIKAQLLPHTQRGAVRAALLDRFSNRALPDGSRGFFHPDALTFGQGIAISTIVAAAQAIPGIAYATVTRLRRQSSGGRVPDDGLLNFKADEIAQLDNDPDFPMRGELKLNLEGGR